MCNANIISDANLTDEEKDAKCKPVSSSQTVAHPDNSQSEAMAIWDVCVELSANERAGF